MRIRRWGNWNATRPEVWSERNIWICDNAHCRAQAFTTFGELDVTWDLPVGWKSITYNACDLAVGCSRGHNNTRNVRFHFCSESCATTFGTVDRIIGAASGALDADGHWIPQPEDATADCRVYASREDALNALRASNSAAEDAWLIRCDGVLGGWTIELAETVPVVAADVDFRRPAETSECLERVEALHRLWNNAPQRAPEPEVESPETLRDRLRSVSVVSSAVHPSRIAALDERRSETARRAERVRTPNRNPERRTAAMTPRQIAAAQRFERIVTQSPGRRSTPVEDTPNATQYERTLREIFALNGINED